MCIKSATCSDPYEAILIIGKGADCFCGESAKICSKVFFASAYCDAINIKTDCKDSIVKKINKTSQPSMNSKSY